MPPYMSNFATSAVIHLLYFALLNPLDSFFFQIFNGSLLMHLYINSLKLKRFYRKYIFFTNDTMRNEENN